MGDMGQLQMRLTRIFLALALVSPWIADGQATEPIAVTARHLIDGAGRKIDNGTVVVSGNRITSVGALPAGFRGRRIDLGEATILPGLIDVHSHIAWYFNAQGRYHTPNDGETPAQGAIAAAGNAYETLVSGVTLFITRS